MSSHVSKKIDFRSLCYGVDKYMDAPEPNYIFPNKVIYSPMKRNQVSPSEQKRGQENNKRP